jgi:hypothetical protein
VGFGNGLLQTPGVVAAVIRDQRSRLQVVYRE